MDFQHSPKAQALIEKASTFLHQEIEPVEADYQRELMAADTPWQVLPVIEQLKAKAKAQGLWNLFLPDSEHGAGLSNVDYAPIAEITGRSAIMPEVFNCNAPDTGNMEVLVKYGTEAQKSQWLERLLTGEIRSAFCMTEPNVASSDATNMEATCVEQGNDIVINGHKWWTTGIGHPNCEMLIFMGATDPNAVRHQRHSMVLVPRDSAGVTVGRMLQTMGFQDPPFGHGEVNFTDVRVPKENVIAGFGRGFEVAQGRLGPGRIHHCMRLIGAAEKALELLCQRGLSRQAFGKPLVELGGNRERIAEARIKIEQARLLTLHAAWKIDQVGAKGAMSEISQIKVVVPKMAQDVIDMAMQIHGGAGLSQDFPLAMAWTNARCLRFADGPDEVHRNLIAKIELRKYA